MKNILLLSTTVLLLSLSSSCKDGKPSGGSYAVQFAGKEYSFPNSYSERIVYPDNSFSDLRFLSSSKATFTATDIGSEDATLYLSFNQAGDGEYEVMDTEDFLKIEDSSKKAAHIVLGIDSIPEINGSYSVENCTIQVKVKNGIYHFSTAKPIPLIKEHSVGEAPAFLTISDLCTDNTI